MNDQDAKEIGKISDGLCDICGSEELQPVIIGAPFSMCRKCAGKKQWAKAVNK